jgi:hypothetical protein
MQNTSVNLESNGPALWIVNGRAREGKTTLARKIFQQYDGPRRLYIDPNESVQEGVIIRDIKSLSYYIFSKDAKRSTWAVTYYPETDDLPEELDRIAQALMDMERPFCLCVDEFFNFSRTGHKLCQKLVRLIRVRAKFPAVVILVSHRPTDIPPAYISTVNRWATFRQTYKPDVERIKQDTGCMNAELVQALEPHHLALWSGRELEFFDPKGNPTTMAPESAQAAPEAQKPAGPAEPSDFQ